MKPSNLKTKLKTYYQVFIVIFIGIILSSVSFTVVRKLENQIIKANFERDSFNRINAFNREIDYTYEIVENVYSLFESSLEVTREEFDTFTVFNTGSTASSEIIFISSIDKVRGWQDQLNRPLDAVKTESGRLIATDKVPSMGWITISPASGKEDEIIQPNII